ALRPGSNPFMNEERKSPSKDAATCQTLGAIAGIGGHYPIGGDLLYDTGALPVPGPSAYPAGVQLGSRSERACQNGVAGHLPPALRNPGSRRRDTPWRLGLSSVSVRTLARIPLSLHGEYFRVQRSCAERRSQWAIKRYGDFAAWPGPTRTPVGFSSTPGEERRNALSRRLPGR